MFAKKLAKPNRPFPVIDILIPGHLPYLRALDLEAYGLEFCWGRDRWHQELSQQHVAGRVARLDGQIVGFSLYAMMRGYYSLQRLVVAESWRRQRIGTDLMNCLKIQVQNHEHPHGITAVIPETFDAAALWLQDQGFDAVLSRGWFGARDGYAFAYAGAKPTPVRHLTVSLHNRVAQHF